MSMDEARRKEPDDPLGREIDRRMALEGEAQRLHAALSAAEAQLQEAKDACGEWLKPYDNLKGAIKNLRQAQMTAKENYRDLMAPVGRLRKLESVEVLFREVLNALAAPTESGVWDAFDWQGWVERAIALDAESVKEGGR